MIFLTKAGFDFARLESNRFYPLCLGAARGTFVTREAEVSDASIDYAGIYIAGCNARLAGIGIRVREAVPGVTFGPPPT